MYDENAYRETYNQVNRQQCVFERSVLRRCVSCEYAHKHLIAEREAMGCDNAEAHAQCDAFKQRLKQAAAFVLKLTAPDAPLPHVKELKLQCGGLLGLARVVAGPQVDTVDNAIGVLRAALKQYGSLDGLPYPEMLQAIRAYEARPPRR
jgi:hypothetical protein